MESPPWLQRLYALPRQGPDSITSDDMLRALLLIEELEPGLREGAVPEDASMAIKSIKLRLAKGSGAAGPAAAAAPPSTAPGGAGGARQNGAVVPEALVYDCPMANFWAGLRQAEIEGDFLKLPEGCFLLDDQDMGRELLIRGSYSALLRIVLALMLDDITKVAITGSPGIGKSYFLFYLMFTLATTLAQPVVVLHIRGLQRVLCFTGSTVLTGTLRDFYHQLDDPKTWYLVDEVEPVFCRAKTVLVSSPNRNIYHAFLKQRGATQRFMPVWTKDEIDLCRARLHTELEQEVVDDLWAKWGGRPRYVLEKALDPVVQASLDFAIYSCPDVMTLVRSLSEHGRVDKASDRLLTIEVGEDYATTRMAFASSYIAEGMSAQPLMNKQEEVQMWLRATEDNTIFGSLRGVLFERLAHRALQEGGEFDFRDLDGPEQGKVTITRSPLMPPFRSLGEVSQIPAGVYARLRSRTFAAVDALIKPNMLFQMSVGSEHPVKLAGLNAVMGTLSSTSSGGGCDRSNDSASNSRSGSDSGSKGDSSDEHNSMGGTAEVSAGVSAEEVQLFFVVPPAIFKTFKRQAFEQPKPEKGADPSSKPRKLKPVRPVRQLVLKVEFRARVAHARRAGLPQRMAFRV
uniref:Crinkler (CRN) family protein n=1 Tax=Chlamydomonas leiostraca TaxID=1034604 RepID=A0A7S0WNW8_9CHLO|mmetsp:Transcript_21075/g.53560  ORF Transcript_21075/g.53560 Transcript_21075/m.53560 type:complete len:628 (+) Transcript_21075:103-1986(+)